MTGAPGPRAALSDGLEAAGAWFGGALLVGAVLATALVPGAPLRAVLLQASGSLIAAGGGVLLIARPRVALRPPQVALAVLLLVAGFGVVLTAVGRTAVPATTAAFPLTATKLALLGFAAGAGRRRAPVAVAAALVVLTEAVAAGLGARYGLAWRPDVPPLAMLALVAVVTAGFRTITGRIAAPRRAAEAAAELDALTRTRALARSRSAAVVHDGVLGDLAAVAALPAGPLPPAASSALAGTLALLATPDWGSGEPTGPIVLPGGAVLAAVRAAERAGLDIALDGDLVALGRLAPEVELALGRAVEQCLANVGRHAGTDEAEVTVLADRTGVSVMVADAGRGFEPHRVGSDRLGLTTSIGGRLASVGGEARVFARPGVGTTVLLTVPLGVSRSRG